MVQLFGRTEDPDERHNQQADISSSGGHTANRNRILSQFSSQLISAIRPAFACDKAVTDIHNAHTSSNGHGRRGSGSVTIGSNSDLDPFASPSPKLDQNDAHAPSAVPLHHGVFSPVLLDLGGRIVHVLLQERVLTDMVSIARLSRLLLAFVTPPVSASNTSTCNSNSNSNSNGSKLSVSVSASVPPQRYLPRAHTQSEQTDELSVAGHMHIAMGLARLLLLAIQFQEECSEDKGGSPCPVGACLLKLLREPNCKDKDKDKDKDAPQVGSHIKVLAKVWRALRTDAARLLQRSDAEGVDDYSRVADMEMEMANESNNNSNESVGVSNRGRYSLCSGMSRHTLLGLPRRLRLPAGSGDTSADTRSSRTVKGMREEDIHHVYLSETWPEDEMSTDARRGGETYGHVSDPFLLRSVYCDCLPMVLAACAASDLNGFLEGEEHVVLGHEDLTPHTQEDEETRAVEINKAKEDTIATFSILQAAICQEVSRLRQATKDKDKDKDKDLQQNSAQLGRCGGQMLLLVRAARHLASRFFGTPISTTSAATSTSVDKKKKEDKEKEKEREKKKKKMLMNNETTRAQWASLLAFLAEQVLPLLYDTFGHSRAIQGVHGVSEAVADLLLLLPLHVHVHSNSNLSTNSSFNGTNNSEAEEEDGDVLGEASSSVNENDNENENEQDTPDSPSDVPDLSIKIKNQAIEDSDMYAINSGLGGEDIGSRVWQCLLVLLQKQAPELLAVSVSNSNDNEGNGNTDTLSRLLLSPTLCLPIIRLLKRVVTSSSAGSRGTQTQTQTKQEVTRHTQAAILLSRIISHPAAQQDPARSEAREALCCACISTSSSGVGQLRAQLLRGLLTEVTLFYLRSAQSGTIDTTVTTTTEARSAAEADAGDMVRSLLEAWAALSCTGLHDGDRDDSASASADSTDADAGGLGAILLHAAATRDNGSAWTVPTVVMTFALLYTKLNPCHATPASRALVVELLPAALHILSSDGEGNRKSNSNSNMNNSQNRRGEAELCLVQFVFLAFGQAPEEEQSGMLALLVPTLGALLARTSLKPSSNQQIGISPMEHMRTFVGKALVHLARAHADAFRSHVGSLSDTHRGALQMGMTAALQQQQQTQAPVANSGLGLGKLDLAKFSKK